MEPMNPNVSLDKAPGMADLAQHVQELTPEEAEQVQGGSAHSGLGGLKTAP